MKKSKAINYLTIIVCCFFASCSQDPSSSENHIGEVSGMVSFSNNVSDINEFEVRAYSYVPQKWKDNNPVNATTISSDGSYAMKLPQGNYIFTLYNAKQNGPSFYYQFQHQFPCKTYELRLQNHKSEHVFANQYLYCEPETISVPENGYLPGINFDIQKIGTISGQISQTDGTPFTQVTIKAFDCKIRDDQTYGKYDISLSAQSRPDADGHYTICCLPEGNYILKAEADQPQYVTIYYDNAYFKDQAKLLEIKSGNNWNINLTIQPGTIIRGQIKSEENPDELIKNVVVSALTTSTNYVIKNSAPSDVNGLYTIYGLPKLRYILKANADHTDYQSCYYHTKYSINDANAFSVNSTDTLIKDFDLQKPGLLLATIVDDEDNTDIINKQIYVNIYEASDFDFVKKIYCDNNGVIRDYLKGGEYIAEIITDGTPYASIFHSNEISLQNADIIYIKNGEEERVTFKLQKEGSIKGHVGGQDCNNTDYYNDLHSYTVVVYSKKNPLRMYKAITDGYGNYEIDGLPADNEYVVRVQTDRTPHISEYYNQTYFKQTANDIQVEYGKTIPEIDFDLECGRRIYGKVTNDTDNTPIPGMTINITNLNKNEVYATTTDNNGMYEILGIPSGYEQSISSAYEYSIQTNTANTSFVKVDHNNTIYFERSTYQREVNFRLELLPTISGVITCPSRQQFQYSFENIIPGNYDLIIIDEKDNEIPIVENYELQANQNKIEDFDL
jgi:hypothetical protein